MSKETLDPDKWFRIGRGRRVEVPKLSPEACTRALGVLPDAYRPYTLVIDHLAPSDSGYRPFAEEVDPARLAERVSAGSWRAWLVSEQLSGSLLRQLPDVDTKLMATNGWIILEFEREFRGEVEPPAIAIVNKVATRDGREKVHSEYVEIFESLLKFLRRGG